MRRYGSKPLTLSTFHSDVEDVMSMDIFSRNAHSIQKKRSEGTNNRGKIKKTRKGFKK